MPWTLRAVLHDPEGRYVFIKGLIGDVPVTLALICPQLGTGYLSFSCSGHSWGLYGGPVAVGGDLNVPLILAVDVWRIQLLGERDYMFFSPPHGTYSRIDLFLAPHAQLPAVSSCSIGAITWSDHAPVLLCYALSDVSATRSRVWKLNNSLLQDPVVLTDVQRELHCISKLMIHRSAIPGFCGRLIRCLYEGY